MIDLVKLTDTYERKARIYPALLCVLPVIVAISLSFPMIYTQLSGLVALVGAFGGVQLLANLARDRGKRLEVKLFDKWGGIPSVTILRHNDTLIPAPAKARYHALLADQTGIDAPLESIEIETPLIADDVYRSWSDHLKVKARDECSYPLLFKENINYGFRRNLLGLKWHCVFTGMLGLVLTIAPKFPVFTLSQIDWAIVILMILYVLVFAFVVNGDWVRMIAIEYAKRLVEVTAS